MKTGDTSRSLTEHRTEQGKELWDVVDLTYPL